MTRYVSQRTDRKKFSGYAYLLRLVVVSTVDQGY
ncbi:MAG: hypothetical protein QOF62_132 [Pyrinomonadaceae bacterium]|jgi:hypothetical protein|nr:hypothetical protein [Pyrinomonadaceae bacterium]